MRMPGQLQRHAELRGVPRVARLVIEQDDRGAGGSSFENRCEVPDGMSLVARCAVGDPGDNELCAVSIEHDVPVLERPNAAYRAIDTPYRKIFW